MIWIAWFTILLAFLFTFTNGFQDASSVAATFISSRSATPRQGIIFVAAMDFIGALFGGSAVAFTISGLLALETGALLVPVVLAGILAALIWNILTWWMGLPSSSTHGLIGGLVGAGLAAGGVQGVHWGITTFLEPPHEITGLTKIIVFLAVSVLLGFSAGYFMRKATRVLLRNAKRSVNRDITRLNWIAAAVMAFFNGANDSQKQLGIIALVLLAAGLSSSLDIPLWARFGCASLLGAGTLCGGWRIMATLGRKIFSIDPIHSFDSQVSSGSVLAASTLAGAPVSSSHIISTSVIGVGAAENVRKVQWSVGREIILVMLLTIPVTIVLAFGISLLLFPLTGSVP
ncbi:MAG: Phosphate transporter family protein [Methanoregulaceae archaeon PtaB.Bin056]|nr:MAG: Phosphate transporter family protein [Methanoregulaceae archaeon PtaB.Bin056]